MLFGVVSGVNREMGVSDGGGDCRRERTVLGGQCGTFHCNQWEFVA